MRKTTKGKGLVGAVITTVLVALFMLLLTGTLIVGCMGGNTDGFAIGVMLFCAFLYLAIAVGVIVALCQRWKEIKGGEEDEAKKY